MVKKLNKPIYVVDAETTGLEGHPDDLIVEIGIYRINIDLSVEYVYSTLISYPEAKKSLINKSYWSVNLSSIKYKDLVGNPDLNTVWSDIKKILDGKNVLSWKMGYDFGKFFDKMNHSLPKITYSKLKCPMLVSTNIIKTEWKDSKNSWKWPKLTEASKYYNIFLDTDDFHRADYDAHVTALIVVEMIKKGDYSIN